MDKQQTKYCQGCQAQLPLDARKCPYCQSNQLTRGEVKLDRMIHALLPSRSPATTCLIIGMVVYFVIISIDIIMHPSYGLREALNPSLRGADN